MAVAGFVLLMGGAMAAYPGGHLWDKSSPGYDFWRNFWCDLLRSEAYNGVQNLVAPALARTAMSCLAVGILSCFCLTPFLFKQRRWLGLSVSVLGGCGALGLVLATWTSGGQMPRVHALAVLMAGPVGLCALVGTLVGLRRGIARGYLLLGAGTLLVSLTSLIQYLREFAFQVASSPFLPFSQKLSTLLALSWILLVSARARRA
jgi:hypothetical protein